MESPDRILQIKAAVAACFALLTTLWGWIGWGIIIWICCMVLDYITGSFAANAHGEWSSTIARQGLWHKLGEIVAVLVAALCDVALKVIVSGAGLTMPEFLTALVTPVVLFWYVLTELGSIIENAGRLGAPVPKFLIKRLKKLREAVEEQQKEAETETAENEAE